MGRSWNTVVQLYDNGLQEFCRTIRWYWSRKFGSWFPFSTTIRRYSNNSASVMDPVVKDLLRWSKVIGRSIECRRCFDATFVMDWDRDCSELVIHIIRILVIHHKLEKTFLIFLLYGSRLSWLVPSARISARSTGLEIRQILWAIITTILSISDSICQCTWNIKDKRFILRDFIIVGCYVILESTYESFLSIHANIKFRILSCHHISHFKWLFTVMIREESIPFIDLHPIRILGWDL